MEKKQNKVLATILLSVVILLGAGVWGVLYSQGWFVALVAFVTAFLGILVYGKFAEVTKLVYIISGVAIVVLNIIASFLSIGITVAIEEKCSLAIAFEAVFKVINEFIPDLAKDAGLCVVLTVLGLVGVKKTYEQRQAKTNAKVVAENVETTVEPSETQATDETKTEDLDMIKPEENVDINEEKNTEVKDQTNDTTPKQ